MQPPDLQKQIDEARVENGKLRALLDALRPHLDAQGLQMISTSLQAHSGAAAAAGAQDADDKSFKVAKLPSNGFWECKTEAGMVQMVVLDDYFLVGNDYAPSADSKKRDPLQLKAMIHRLLSPFINDDHIKELPAASQAHVLAWIFKVMQADNLLSLAEIQEDTQLKDDLTSRATGMRDTALGMLKNIKLVGCVYPLRFFIDTFTEVYFDVAFELHDAGNAVKNCGLLGSDMASWVEEFQKVKLADVLSGSDPDGRISSFFKDIQSQLEDLPIADINVKTADGLFSKLMTRRGKTRVSFLADLVRFRLNLQDARYTEAIAIEGKVAAALNGSPFWEGLRGWFEGANGLTPEEKQKNAEMFQAHGARAPLTLVAAGLLSVQAAALQNPDTRTLNESMKDQITNTVADQMATLHTTVAMVSAKPNSYAVSMDETEKVKFPGAARYGGLNINFSASGNVGLPVSVTFAKLKGVEQNLIAAVEVQLLNSEYAAVFTDGAEHHKYEFDRLVTGGNPGIKEAVQVVTQEMLGDFQNVEKGFQSLSPAEGALPVTETAVYQHYARGYDECLKDYRRGGLEQLHTKIIGKEAGMCCVEEPPAVSVLLHLHFLSKFLFC